MESTRPPAPVGLTHNLNKKCITAYFCVFIGKNKTKRNVTIAPYFMILTHTHTQYNNIIITPDKTPPNPVKPATTPPPSPPTKQVKKIRLANRKFTTFGRQLFTFISAASSM